GGAIAVVGISIAWMVYMRKPGISLALKDRLPLLHNFLSHKWYFDEMIDAAVVRPAASTGRFFRDVIEREVVQGMLVGGATSAVRAGSSMARALQSGYLRAYALLVLFGLLLLGLYFLIAAA
ncbi:MAG: NADH-quinone oxidoreductase subunit, partial [Thermoleophilaceae bacterium]|nr:NADH-quinone oxidoreductase subunit [Thermoleophilaceae bacterium]